MDRERTIELAGRLLEAWNTQEVERVVDCYTADVRYRDPNTRGFVQGSDAMRRYLTKLFDRWQMHWTLREAYPLRDDEGAAVLWRAKFRCTDDDAEVEIDGMDLALARGDRLSRNDVYFDRAALAPLAEHLSGTFVPR
ncbi:nuclear transport factor 2 family protein [Mycobacterium sp. SMC-2]|uniref:nuclear transport factor 2 family protein n=1 Tax=Mycobacterium sp. SMC-2 TaxID=2857058 RepID=UPI0021B1AE16|nr:nuclear transport factor 2 family protein [Mycobacterium sp. SMC-2]UXA08096.1 nuclear transport factor 2 family protein [Mycobacterium sp. SMC-2]